MRDRVAAFDKATDDKATGLDKQTGAAGGLSATIREGVLGCRRNVFVLSFPSRPL